ncbi:MAG: RNA 2',3'-cyclic phosphodiesterase [Phycisphaeraceae bacterium]
MSADADADDSLRLFIAVPCVASRGLRRVIAALEELRPGVKPVDPEALHLTLRFLGPTPRRRVTVLGEALRRAVDAARVGPIEVRWATLGRFPTGQRKPARVIFAAPADPSPIERLAAAVSAQLEALDPPVPAEERPFSAHLTLARVKPARRGGDPTRAVERLCERHAATDLGGGRIEAVQLLASTLTPRGPVYEVQRAVQL